MRPWFAFQRHPAPGCETGTGGGEPELITSAGPRPLTRPAVPSHSMTAPTLRASRSVARLLLKHDKGPFPATPRPTPPAASFHTEVGAAELARSWGRPKHGRRFPLLHIPFCRHAARLLRLANRNSTSPGRRQKVVGPLLQLCQGTGGSSGSAPASAGGLGQTALARAAHPNYLSLPETGPALGP